MAEKVDSFTGRREAQNLAGDPFALVGCQKADEVRSVGGHANPPQVGPRRQIGTGGVVHPAGVGGAGVDRIHGDATSVHGGGQADRERIHRAPRHRIGQLVRHGECPVRKSG